jgi:hypothetical protein
MLRAIISRIFRSGRLCLQLMVRIMHPLCCRQVAWKRRDWCQSLPLLPGYWPATSWVHYTISCKHSLPLLKMGEIIARSMSSWLRIINKSSLHLVGCLYLLLESNNLKRFSSVFQFALCFYLTEALYLLCYVKTNFSFIQRILLLQRK